jgi:lysophospholipid acyltransferase (LPLAT)-like uncharacterized protein
MHPLVARLAGRAMALYVRLLARTCRITPFTTEQVVLAIWHGSNLATFAAAYRHRGRLPHASFSTRGPRGTVITTMFEALPTPVAVMTLPDERNRQEGRRLALRLARLAEEGHSLVVTPDGPFGPYRKAKPGALIVARASGLPIVPIGMGVRPALHLHRRWDRQVVPLPFSRIRVVQGEPLQIGPREPIRPYLAALEAELNRVSGLAEFGTR